MIKHDLSRFIKKYQELSRIIKNYQELSENSAPVSLSTDN